MAPTRGQDPSGAGLWDRSVYWLNKLSSADIIVNVCKMYDTSLSFDLDDSGL